MRDKYLWVEKYRPQTIEDCILPGELKKTFLDMVKRGEPQNLLLSGTAGIGKTTVAQALCRDIGVDSMIINCSENGNITGSVSSPFHARLVDVFQAAAGRTQ